MLQQEDDDTQAAPAEENQGKKIKMGKLGKKGKKGDTKAAAGGAKSGASAAKGGDIMAGYNPKNDKSPSGGFSEQDIEFMKKAIQVLCQSTNPLGKSIDFVTDDIDSMNKEYEHWIKESSSCQQQLHEQQKITEEVIQPLQDQQAELE